VTRTTRQFLGADPLYSVLHFNAISPVQTLILVGLGCLCGFLVAGLLVDSARWGVMVFVLAWPGLHASGGRGANCGRPAPPLAQVRLAGFSLPPSSLGQVVAICSEPSRKRPPALRAIRPEVFALIGMGAFLAATSALLSWRLS
jgi:H+/Cl- antiporter ClcA